jgi:hypothetical protein
MGKSIPTEVVQGGPLLVSLSSLAADPRREG